ncbi:Sec-independent protein translocase TatB [Subtercola sp. Z020]|uniref:Sec-independent protein translocase TatB n=1 Tax=Subtercola sp. Z020 TaxID=2080582 RepID=UPI0018EA9974|nr:Sec-independent protein translocase TatB [Subtercola sp. Z020]
MFGLTIEKLFVIAVIAAIIIGPQHLPRYASDLAAIVRTLREFVDVAKARVTAELGPHIDAREWEKLDPRQYDPRRIVRDALTDNTAVEEQPTATPSAPNRSTEPAPPSPPEPPTLRRSATGGWQGVLLSRITTAPHTELLHEITRSAAAHPDPLSSGSSGTE